MQMIQKGVEWKVTLLPLCTPSHLRSPEASCFPSFCVKRQNICVYTGK